jgi:hypothetical protein
MNRMLFSNNSNYNGLRFNVVQTQHNVVKAAPAPVPLNAKMIDRVHKAKPGCSACGKKVA